MKSCSAVCGSRGAGQLKWAAVLIPLFEITTVIVLRAHYTMDVFTGLITALLVAIVADRAATKIDG
jgi:membrane-associated phospholipid phosphatase